MDLLRKELERKKKALQGASSSIAGSAAVTSGRGGRRFMKAGALRQAQEEEELAAKQNKKKRKRTKAGYGGVGDGGGKRNKEKTKQTHEKGSLSQEGLTDKGLSSRESGDAVASNRRNSFDGAAHTLEDLQKLSATEVTQKLRQMGLPVRLFGERTQRRKEKRKGENSGDADRLKRLFQAIQDHEKNLATASEMDEFRLPVTRNPFLEKDEEAAPLAQREQDNVAAVRASKDIASLSKKQEAGSSASGTHNDNVDKGDGDKNDVHKKIYKYFKGLIKEWEEDLAARPDEVKRSIKGKNETKTVKQIKDYIRPLFKALKKRTLEESMTTSLAQIVEYCLEGEFVKANDTYMDLAIGRAAWPIGVTMVGIHARSGRAKIESKNVAHVMNSELQRKYLTSAKRLMTYAQTKRADVAPSKKVLV